MSTTKEILEEIVHRAKKGISHNNKEYLLAELEAIAKSIEEWKKKKY